MIDNDVKGTNQICDERVPVCQYDTYTLTFVAVFLMCFLLCIDLMISTVKKQTKTEKLKFEVKI